MLLEYLDVFPLSFTAYKFFPRQKHVIQRHGKVERMRKKATELPVIEHMLKAYKNWYVIRDNLPKKSRYTLGDKIDSRFLQVLELLQVASYQSPADKLPTLTRAVSAMDLLKFLLRICWEIGALDDKKYLSLSEDLQEVARQIGGWKRGIETKTPAR